MNMRVMTRIDTNMRKSIGSLQILPNHILNNKQKHQDLTMITTEKILEIAREHLEEFDTDNGAECAWSDFTATKEQLLRFANKIYNEGHEDGWESRANAEYLNSSYPTGLVGDPQ
jgi:hypothetical protein